MIRLFPVLSVAFAVALVLGCSERPESLLGRVEDLTAIEGYLFPADPAVRTPFRGGSSQAQSVGRLLLKGVPADDLKYQGRAAFVLTCSDGRKVDVAVYKPANVVLIGGEAFFVDVPALMVMLSAIARP